MTLLEIMLVLAILGTLMAFLVGPALYNRFKESQVKNTQLLLSQYEGALVQWRASNPQADCPPSLDEIYAQKLVNAKPVDMWGQALIFRCPGQGPNGYDLFSKGPDRQEGTADDVRLPNQ